MKNTLPFVFIISLPASVDRRAHMRKILDPLPLQYEFVDAIDGNQLSAETVNQVYDEKASEIYCGRELSLAEIGCYMSHVKAYETISQRNISEALILEDDVYLSPDLIPFLEHRNRLPKDWRLVHLAKKAEIDKPIWHRKSYRIYKKYRVGSPWEVVWGALGYLIKGTLAKEFIQSAYPIFSVIDGRLFNVKCSFSAYYSLIGDEYLVRLAETEGVQFKSIIDPGCIREASRKPISTKLSFNRIKRFCRDCVVRVLVYFFLPKKHQGHPIISDRDGGRGNAEFLHFITALYLGWKRR